MDPQQRIFLIEMLWETAYADGEGKPRGVHDPIPLETAHTASNARGTMAMGHGDDPNSARAEFFINLADNKAIDRQPDDLENKTGFATFGHVVSGMDVVDAIAALDACRHPKGHGSEIEARPAR
jgi:cyclophilin family peptidyl-prolyl cis-trans isomerase